MPTDAPAAYDSLAALIDANQGKPGSEIAKMAEEAGFTLPAPATTTGEGTEAEGMMSEGGGEGGSTPKKDMPKSDADLEAIAQKNIDKLGKGGNGPGFFSGKGDATGM